MYDIVRIDKMINDIERFFLELEQVGLNEKNLKDSVKLNAASMSIFSIINRSIDIAQEILVKNELPMPNDYKSCFPELARAGFFDKNLASKMENLADERGLFAHHYFSAVPKEVLKISKGVYIIKEFIEKVKKIVSRAKNDK